VRAISSRTEDGSDAPHDATTSSRIASVTITIPDVLRTPAA
jgi:hypothetical protein